MKIKESSFDKTKLIEFENFYRRNFSAPVGPES